MKPRSKKKSFEPPTIFGVLCDENPKVPRGLEQKLADRADGAILLPFQVERRNLRNIITCMRLMDIAGLVIAGGHRRAILPHLARVDPLAAQSGAVDTVVRRGKAFVGECAAARACVDWLAMRGIQRGRGRRACIADSGEWFLPLSVALGALGWRVRPRVGKAKGEETLFRFTKAYLQELSTITLQKTVELLTTE
jgi:hypothetical protein